MSRQKKPDLYDKNAEIAAIGAAFISPELFTNTLEPEDFGAPGFTALWSTCQELIRDGITPDSVTVPPDAFLDGYTAYTFTNACPSCTHFNAYADIIRGFSRRRKLEAAADRIGKAAYRENETERAELIQEGLELFKDARSGGGWDILSLKNAYQPRSPREYVVNNLIVKPSLNIAFGPPGGLKSMLLADLCVCVAGGLNWLPVSLGGAIDESVDYYESLAEDTPSHKTTQTPTLWIDFDNGIRRTNERMDALATARGLPEDTPFYYVSMPVPWLNATEDDSIERLLRHVEQVNAGLVVIDNLGVVKDCDENSAEMAGAMLGFRRVVEETGAAMVLIHHQRKTGGGTNVRLGETLRGHSSIEASLDDAFLILRDKDDKDKVSITCTKARGMGSPVFGARFEYVHKDDTTELELAYFLGAKIESKVQKTNRAILEAVRKEPGIKKTPLIEVVNERTSSGKNYVGKCIVWLVEHNKLRVEPGPSNAHLHFLVS